MRAYSFGAAFLLALFVPNLVWSRTGRLAGYDASGENQVLRVAELPLIAAAAVLGIGHIGIHLQHRRALLP